MKKRLSILLGLALIVCALIACGESNNTGSVTTNGSTDSTPQATAAHFKVGQVVKVGDTWQVTVNSVKTSKGDDFSKPDAGNTYIIINITVKNISSQEQTISSLLNFSFKSADGTKGKDAITLTTGVTPPPDGKVAAGDLAKGDLVYEASASQKTGTLAFEADIISGGQSIWDINL